MNSMDHRWKGETMNPYGAPEIEPAEVSKHRASGQSPFLLLDVRELFELQLAAIPGEDVCHAPLSEISERGVTALPESVLDPNQPIVVFCHHGIRSAQVTVWLKQHGWQDVRNMRGGIDAYAQEIDPAVGAYE